VAREYTLVDAMPGDLVFIGDIRSAKLNTPSGDFAQESEREARLAFLCVKRGDGVVVELKRPLILIAESATAQFIQLADYPSAYRSMLNKLEKATGLDDIEDLMAEPVSDWPAARANVHPDYARAVVALQHAVKHFDEESFAVFGYIIGRAEAEGMLLESAIRGRAAKAYQAKAAVGRHVKSRVATEPLRSAARRIIEAQGDISLTACAKQIAEELAQDPDRSKSPEPKWIVGHIRELFEPRGDRREYRPKRGNR